MTTNSVQVDIAAAIVTELNAHAFSTKFTAKRQAGEINYELKETSDVVVDVVPFSMKTKLGSRGTVDYTVVTSICIRKKIPSNEQGVDGWIPNAQVDPLFVLLQEINDYFIPSQDNGRSGRRLADAPEAAWVENTKENEDGIMGPYSKFLMEEKQFVGIVRVTYEVSRVPV